MLKNLKNLYSGTITLLINGDFCVNFQAFSIHSYTLAGEVKIRERVKICCHTDRKYSTSKIGHLYVSTRVFNCLFILYIVALTLKSVQDGNFLRHLQELVFDLK